MSNHLPPAPSPTTTRIAQRVIIVAYLLLGAMYAVVTPPWQAPDEPAHYNYVRYVAIQGTLPELRPGDYPAAYLEELKARRFSPELPIDPIRYQSHQPPLYYILAAAVYRVASTWELPRLVVLRAFSVFLGALALLVAYRLVEALRPNDPVLALGTIAMTAALPMHLAMSAAVNNDALSGLLLTTIAWRLIAMSGDDWTPRRTLGLGALLGLALLTKMQTFVAFALVAAALLWDLGRAQRWRPTGGWRRVAGMAAVLVGTALAMALPWLCRNAHLYGPHDPFGLVRHDEVVAGQPTTGAFIAQHGGLALLSALVRTTFQSFWGVFGWMGVPMHPQVYQALAALTLLAGFGVGLCAWRARARVRGWQAGRDRSQAAGQADPPACDWQLKTNGPATTDRPTRHTPPRTRDLLLLALWFAGTVAGYLWWNLTYLQHQGRYLFPALVPIGLAITAGLREVYRRPPRLLFGALALGIVALLVAGLARGDLPGLSIALLVGCGAALWIAPRLEALWPGSALAITYAALATLSLLALPMYIVPYLTP